MSKPSSPKPSARISLADAASLMGVSQVVARGRLRRAGVASRPGRQPDNHRMVALYPRSAIEALIAQGVRPRGRPRKDS